MCIDLEDGYGRTKETWTDLGWQCWLGGLVFWVATDRGCESTLRDLDDDVTTE